MNFPLIIIRSSNFMNAQERSVVKTWVNYAHSYVLYALWTQRVPGMLHCFSGHQYGTEKLRIFDARWSDCRNTATSPKLFVPVFLWGISISIRNITIDRESFMGIYKVAGKYK